jgi:hypothetical protein
MIRMQFGYVDVPGIQERWGHRSAALQKSRKSVIVSIGKELETKLRQAAPRKTGIFADGITSSPSEDAFGITTVNVESRGAHAIVGGRYKLHELIRQGTKPHAIPTGGAAAQVAKGYPLGFYWENGPKGPGKYHFWSVWHPGTKPNPFVKQTVYENMDRYRELLRTVGLEVKNVRTGL